METKGEKQNKANDTEDAFLQITKEKLDIVKKWVQTADVKVYKEILQEERTFTMPILREELVIEKKVVSSENTASEDTTPETIRIPLSIEQVSFTKHKTKLEDVSIYKQQVNDIKHIEASLKKEQVRIKTYGNL